MDDKENHQAHLLNYCFTALQYIGEVNEKLLKRAKEYAEDVTGVSIDSFELRETDDEIEYDDLSFSDEEETDDE